MGKKRKGSQRMRAEKRGIRFELLFLKYQCMLKVYIYTFEYFPQSDKIWYLVPYKYDLRVKEYNVFLSIYVNVNGDST